MGCAMQVTATEELERITGLLVLGVVKIPEHRIAKPTNTRVPRDF